MTTRARNSSDLAIIGASEVFRLNGPEASEPTREEGEAINEARALFETFTDQQMAVALLVLLLDLGRRVEEGGKK